MQNKYDEIYKESIGKPQVFWNNVAKGIYWDKPFDTVLNESNTPFNYWFEGGKLNTCYNAIDRHVEDGYGDQIALIYDSPITNKKAYYSFSQLQSSISKLAGVLKEQGVDHGDTVIIYMPMIPQAVMAMLACARIGAIHSVVFGGFAAKELAIRIDDAQPKALMSASCGIEPGRIIDYKSLLDEAQRIALHKISSVIILQREEQVCKLRDDEIDWHMALEKAHPVDCVSVDANHPLYILYTSGTTGRPKGIVRDNGGHAVACKWTMENLYDMKPGEVFWAASDVGWIVGHSYIVYAPLLNRNTTIVFEGKPIGTPDAGTFWRVIEEHKVKALFTAPTAFRAIKKEDPQGDFLKKYNLSNFQYLYLAGERSDPDTIRWAQKHLKVPVIDHWWQTETGWSIAGNPMGIESFPIKLGSVTKPTPGYDLRILDEEGNQQTPDRLGNITVKLPMPPGSMITLWKNGDRFVEEYMSRYPGYYLTGDSGIIDDDGYVHIMSRIDDVINVAGHRLSTGQMEEVLCDHADVAEAAVFGVKDDLKGEVPLGLVVLNARVEREHAVIVQELVSQVRTTIGAVAVFKLCAVVSRLPKTRSGKILRATMRSIANKADWNMPATIDDPEVLKEIESTLYDLLA